MTNWNMRTEELELKDGSTIKNYHYEFNSTDRVLAKIVEDAFKGIMDIKADRKTVSISEKPNNSTCSKMEQVDKDINVRSKDCETCKWGEWYRQGYDITMMDDECGGCCSWNSKWTPKDEPQTD